MAQSEFVGVDGCRSGWFSVGLDLGGGAEIDVFPSFRELLDHYSEASLVLVDIPIGLPEGLGGRDCDHEARKCLRPRGASVFPTPTRQTVEQAAKSPKDYIAACGVEHHFAGKKISTQTFAIAPKIAEVDRVMVGRDAGVKPGVREVHPELCFWALNHEKPMEYNKKKEQGRVERLDVLRATVPQTQEIFDRACDKFRRKDVAKDDILDALAAAVVAYRRKGHLYTVPEVPPKDSRGLPMEMVF